MATASASVTLRTRNSKRGPERGAERNAPNGIVDDGQSLGQIASDAIQTDTLDNLLANGVSMTSALSSKRRRRTVST